MRGLEGKLECKINHIITIIFITGRQVTNDTQKIAKKLEKLGNLIPNRNLSKANSSSVPQPKAYYADATGIPRHKISRIPSFFFSS